MIELRWVEANNVIADILSQPTKKLQYRSLFYPVMIASGDVVLSQKTKDELEWIDVPTVKE